MGIRVLLVETNRRNHELMSRYLASQGIASGVADSMEALNALSLEGYDCVLIDLMGLDKRIWATCARLQEKGIPFAVIYPSQSRGKAAAGPGAGGVLTKPIRPPDLLTMIHTLAGR